MRLRPGGEGKPRVDPTWPELRVTLNTAGPVPFWDALDRLCKEGRLQREYPPAGTNFFPVKPPFDLTLVPGKTRPPASDTGSLRVELLRIRHSRERDYEDNDSEFSNFRRATARKRDGETSFTERSSYAAELLISAEFSTPSFEMRLPVLLCSYSPAEPCLPPTSGPACSLPSMKSWPSALH